MENRYYLFVRPGKTPRELGSTHPKTLEVLKTIDFLRQYYHVPITSYVDHSNLVYFKVDISADGIDFRLYLNNDGAGTVDLSIPGVGIVYDVSAFSAFKFLMAFQDFRTPEDIIEFIKP